MDDPNFVGETEYDLIRWEIGRAGRPATRPFALGAGLTIGGAAIVIMAGPCSVESETQLRAAARAAKESGASVLRGGAFKPRTSPHSFQGLGAEGLRILRAVGDECGMLVVTEIIAHTDVELVAKHADILQIGTRNMHNTPLLHAVGELEKPVLLKRGYAARLEEWLGAADHVRSRGNGRVIMCERGVRGLETVTRYTLDVNAVPAMHRLCDLPVVVDPSHAAGRSDIVAELSRAALAAGADGLLIELHPNPANAQSDGQQSLAPDEFAALMPSLRRIAEAIGRTIA